MGKEINRKSFFFEFVLALSAVSSAVGCTTTPKPTLGKTKKQKNTIHSIKDLNPDQIYLAFMNHRDSSGIRRKLSEIRNYPGYDHIELLLDGKFYGNRPGRFAEVKSLDNLKFYFNGNVREIDIRHVDLKEIASYFIPPVEGELSNGYNNGAIAKGINDFNQNIKGQTYHVLSNNCADLVYNFLWAMGLKKSPVDLDTYHELKRDSDFMTQVQGLIKEYDESIDQVIQDRKKNFKDNPLADNIIFPGAFEEISDYVATIKL